MATRTATLRTRLTIALLGALIAVVHIGPTSVSAAGSPLDHGLGLVAPAVARPYAPGVPAVRSFAVPASIDLGSSMPPVGNQGAVGSCAAWAVGYTLFGHYVRTQGIVGGDHAPMYIYSQVTGGHDVGSSLEEDLSLVQSQGVDTRFDYSQGDFDYVDQPTGAEHANAAGYQFTGWKQLFYGSGQGPAASEAIKVALGGGSPVAIAMPVYSNFDSTGWHYPGIAGWYRGEHAVVAVGYDSYGIIIQNSWGASWGTSGRTDLAYGFVNQAVWDADTAAGITPGVATTTTAVASVLNPTLPGQSVMVNGTVSPSSVSDGVVDVSEGATDYGTVVLTGGGAHWTSSRLALGSHSLTMRYPGSPSFRASTSTAVVQVVQKAGTSTALSFGSPPGAGQSGTLSAAVTTTNPFGVVSGTVHFQDNGADISAGCSAAPEAVGLAVCTTIWAAGRHALTAVFSGNQQYGGSSASLSYPMSGFASATVLTPRGPTTVVAGQQIGVTISVSGGGGVPSGQVTLLDGAAPAGTAALDMAGAAVIFTSGLSTGTHLLTASYGGDSLTNAGVSAPLSVTVTGPAPVPPPAAPAAATVAVTGLDGALWVAHNGGGFTSLGGYILGAPAVAAVPRSGLPPLPMYVITGADHQLWVRADGLGWQRLGDDYCTDNPAVWVTGGPGASVLHVVCRAADGAVWYAATGVSPAGLPSIGGWSALGGATPAGPALYLPAGASAPLVVVVGADHALWTRPVAGGGWTSLGGSCSFFHPAAASVGSTGYRGCRGVDGSMWVSTLSRGAWSALQSTGGGLLDGPGVAALASGGTFYVNGLDSHIYHIGVAPDGTLGAWAADPGASRHGAGAGAA